MLRILTTFPPRAAATAFSSHQRGATAATPGPPGRPPPSSHGEERGCPPAVLALLLPLLPPLLLLLLLLLLHCSASHAAETVSPWAAPLPLPQTQQPVALQRAPAAPPQRTAQLRHPRGAASGSAERRPQRRLGACTPSLHPPPPLLCHCYHHCCQTPPQQPLLLLQRLLWLLHWTLQLGVSGAACLPCSHGVLQSAPPPPPLLLLLLLLLRPSPGCGRS